MKLLRILLITKLFFSCSLFYEKCDYCNLEYKGIENIVLTDNYNFSYHQKCVQIYNSQKENVNPKFIMVNSDISGIIEELKQELEIIGIEFKKYKSVYTPSKLLAEPTLSSYPKIKYKKENTSNSSIHIFDENIKIKIVKGYEMMPTDKNGNSPKGYAFSNFVTIIGGLTELDFKGTLAHELTHVWQHQNEISTSKLNREGLAEVVSAHIFKMDTTYHERYNYNSKLNNRGKVYREGYKKMNFYLELYGWKYFFKRYPYY